MLPISEDPTTVTDAQRAYVFDLLITGRDTIRQTVADLSDAQLHHKTAPDRWSIAENVEHIVLVERGMFSGIQKGLTYPPDPDKRAEIRVTDLDVIKAVRGRNVTLAAPEALVPTGQFASVSAALDAFEQQRTNNISAVENLTADFRAHYARHPAFGWIDTYQALLVLATHPERHRKQIDEIKADPGFPA